MRAKSTFSGVPGVHPSVPEPGGVAGQVWGRVGWWAVFSKVCNNKKKASRQLVSFAVAIPNADAPKAEIGTVSRGL